MPILITTEEMEAVPDSGCSSLSSSGKEIESPSVRSRNSQLSEDEPFSPAGVKSFASGSCNSSSQDSLEPLEQGSACPAQVLIQQFEIEDSSSSPSKRNNRLRHIFRVGRDKDISRSKKYSWPQLNCGELGGCPTTKPNNLVDSLLHVRNVLHEGNVIQNRTYQSENSTGGSHVIVARVSSREDPGPFPLRPRINGLGHHKSASFPSLGSVPCLKYKLLKEGQVQVCRVQHSRNVFSKIASSKFMRRWETHQLMLERDEIVAKIV